MGLFGLPRGGREGGGVDFWNSGEGSFKGLRLFSIHLRNKILEDSEENL